MDWLSALPACTVPAVVAVVLVAESGLLIGLVLPGSSLAVGVGVLAGAGLVPVPVAALTVAAATVGGAVLGHRCAARAGPGTLLPTGWLLGRLLPGRARDLADRSAGPWSDAVARRPVRMAGVSQLVTGSRTLAPRIAARSGVPLSTMLRGTVPAALLWSWGLVAAGTAAGAAAPLLNGVLALAGVPVVVVVTWLLLRRRARAAARRRPVGRPRLDLSATAGGCPRWPPRQGLPASGPRQRPHRTPRPPPPARERTRSADRGPDREEHPVTGAEGRRCTGQVAFVTGAGSGIGRATALAFAAEGAAVAVAGIPETDVRETARLIEGRRPRAGPAL